MIIKCRECGSQVSTEAKACMNCGAPPDPSSTQPSHASSMRAQSTRKDESNVKVVDFDKALYITVCPECGKPFKIKGSTLSKNNTVTCPYHRGPKLKIKELRVVLEDNQRVTYRIVNDFFSSSGRISVLTFWISVILGLIPILIAGRACIMHIPPLLFSIGFPIVLLITFNSIYIKRLQDLNMSSAWVIAPWLFQISLSLTMLSPPPVVNGEVSNLSHDLMIIPYFVGMVAGVISLVLGIMVAFVPGSNTINRYGVPTRKIQVTLF